MMSYYPVCDPNEIWLALYEKCFANWILRDPGDVSDTIQTIGGDPAKLQHRSQTRPGIISLRLTVQPTNCTPP
ncbi:hypothetical protein GJ744_003457 [Endocarpon pusillum]|uniref:Uncharacterized protein n=1 Tax=Endocarpon pusillum TaxID=364733 RepID=A0A8H7AR93_9EURO|nr:hypothetical protein GJ744_003457 [Endocarpon pusillum]